MATLSAKVLSTSKVKLTVSGLDENFAYYRNIKWLVDGEFYDNSVTDPKDKKTEVSITITGLDAGTRYKFTAEIYRYDNNVELATLTTRATTDEEEDTGSFSIVTTTNSSVKISISYPNGADYSRVFIYKSGSSGSDAVNSDDADVYRTSSTYTFSGLSPNTTYKINVYFYTSKSASSVYYQCKVRNFTTEAAPNFNWTYAGYKNGTLVKGSQKISGYGFYVSASEWNELIDVTILKLKSKGKYSSSSYPMTTASNGSKFTAVMFNQVRFAIGSMVSTGIADKSKGDPILADDLNTLMDCLNQV